MRLFKIINSKFPKIFDWYYSRVLQSLIIKDFIPNNYLFFENNNNINDWGKVYLEYFKLKKEENYALLNNRDLLPYNVFRYYAGYFYEKINTYLRSTAKSDNNEYITSRIEIIEKEIKNFPLKENLIVVRRISNKFLKNYLLKNRKLKKGMILADQAFLSTSLDLSYKKDIESNYKPPNDETFFIIKIPIGTNAIYLEPISNREEYELLLQNKLNMQVEKTIQVLNNKIIITKIIPSELVLNYN